MDTLTSFDQTLIYAIGAALVGAGGLVTYVIKAIVPRMLASNDRREAASVGAMEKMSEAVVQIPLAIKSIETGMYALETRVAAYIETSKDAVLDALEDKRLSELTAIVRGKAASPGVQ